MTNSTSGTEPVPNWYPGTTGEVVPKVVYAGASPSRPLRETRGRPLLREQASQCLPDDELFEKLMRAVGDHEDAGTRHVLAAKARQLPPSAVGKVLESLRTQTVRNRAAYVNQALQSEIQERTT